MRNVNTWAMEMWRNLELIDFDHLIANIDSAYTEEEIAALKKVRDFMFRWDNKRKKL